MEKNATNAAQRRMYVVSFGHSDKYLITGTRHEVEHRLHAVEKEFNDALKAKYPDEPFAYFTTPRLTEVDPSHEQKYAGYRQFDDQAVAEIRKILGREIKDMEDTREINSDAPFSDVNPAAAGVGGLL